MKRVTFVACVVALVGLVLVTLLPSGSAAAGKRFSPGPLEVSGGTGVTIVVFNPTKGEISGQVELLFNQFFDVPLIQPFTAGPGGRAEVSFICDPGGGNCEAIPVVTSSSKDTVIHARFANISAERESVYAGQWKMFK